MENSNFEGGLLGLIGINIITFLIVFFTLGIATPWAICIKHNWTCKHTVIEGRRLKFNGTGLGLFGNFIKWWFFTIITLGIYGFWLSIKLKQWEVKNTSFQ